MDIQSVGADSAQSKILDQVGVTMLAKGLKGEQEEAADLMKSIAPLPQGSGSLLDLQA